MSVIQLEQFNKMAKEAVDAYLTRSVPMAESLAKTADENALNPDQIRNLVQLANTMAHLTLFDQKNDGDKVVEFNPADPDTVIKQVFVNGEPEEMGGHGGCCEGCSDYSNSPERSSDLFGDLGGLLEKVKGALKGNSSQSSSPSPTPIGAAPEELPSPADMQDPSGNTSPKKQQMLIIKIRKVASELENKQLQTAYEYKEELDKLASDFARLYGPDFGDFEKDAFALRGELATPIIADLRNCLRMPKLTHGMLSKTARVVDSQTKSMRSLDKLIQFNDKWETFKQARDYLTANIGEYLE